MDNKLKNEQNELEMTPTQEVNPENLNTTENAVFNWFKTSKSSGAPIVENRANAQEKESDETKSMLSLFGKPLERKSKDDSSETDLVTPEEVAESKLIDLENAQKASIQSQINQSDQNEMMKSKDKVESLSRFYDVFQEVKIYLDKNFAFRYNILSNKIEYRGMSSEFSHIAEFIVLDDQSYNTLYLHTQKNVNKNLSHGVFSTVLNSDFVRAYNPFLEFITNKIPGFDPSFDYIGEFIRKVDCSDNDFKDFIFRKWFVGMVVNALHEDKSNDLVLVLKGAQGVGKTRFLRSLIPDCLTDFIYEGNINPNNKEHERHLAEKILIIMDEFEIQSDRQSTSLKSLITRSNVTLRKPYSKNPSNFMKVASFAATTNRANFLKDKTGNRRFAVLDVIGTIDNGLLFPIEYLYYQAFNMIQGGFIHYLQGEEISIMNERNESYVDSDYEEDLLFSIIRKPNKNESKDAYLTASEITKEVCKRNGMNFNPTLIQKIGTLLSNAGFKSGKSSGSKKYEIKYLTK